MPKETKKFINPLLRPSQNIEATQEDLLLEEAQSQRTIAIEGITHTSVTEDGDTKGLKLAKDGSETLIPEDDRVITSHSRKRSTVSRVSLNNQLPETSDRSDLLAEETHSDTLKRRRQAPTFESTHERITIWIDKELKAQFEELAYQRSLSKTSLLNEAIADLLAKLGKN